MVTLPPAPLVIVPLLVIAPPPVMFVSVPVLAIVLVASLVMVALLSLVSVPVLLSVPPVWLVSAPLVPPTPLPSFVNVASFCNVALFWLNIWPRLLIAADSLFHSLVPEPSLVTVPPTSLVSREPAPELTTSELDWLVRVAEFSLVIVEPDALPRVAPFWFENEAEAPVLSMPVAAALVFCTVEASLVNVALLLIVPLALLAMSAPPRLLKKPPVWLTIVPVLLIAAPMPVLVNCACAPWLSIDAVALLSMVPLLVKTLVSVPEVPSLVILAPVAFNIVAPVLLEKEPPVWFTNAALFSLVIAPSLVIADWFWLAMVEPVPVCRWCRSACCRRSSPGPCW